jgi:7-carboxy-7-deazaguanine synthase
MATVATGMTALDAAQNDALVEEMTSAKKIPVIELFGPTIQGEGPLAGSKTMFVRTGGCDYRCAKCDSLHAVIPAAVKTHARRITAAEIVAELLPVMQKTGTRWVTLSGGNPALWDFSQLIVDLHAAGMLVAVETQGTLAPTWLGHADMVVVSPKSPGMGERFELLKFQNFLLQLRGLTMVALKVVVFSQQDIDFALEMGEIATQHMEIVPYGMRYMSLGNPYPPKLEEDYTPRENVSRPILIDTLLREYRQLIDEMTHDRRVTDWKFLPQLHVLAFGNEVGR